MYCSCCTEALSQTGRLIGTEWRVLARSLHAGVTLLREEEEEERIEGSGKERLFGTSAPTVQMSHMGTQTADEAIDSSSFHIFTLRLKV